MRTLLKILIALAVLGGLGYASLGPIQNYLAEQRKITWRTASVEEGAIVEVVNSTGTIKPKLQITVGSFVSGPIEELHCEFNQEVRKGDLLAKIDPRIYKSNVTRDAATLANREADVMRVKAQLQQAINDEKRAIALRAEDQTFLAQAEMDKIRFTRLGLEAQLKVAETTIAQARASLDNSQINLDYTEIRSPVDGIVINRKIDPGQTLAAQFQTPELFVIAPDMREEMHVHASVDEADIGRIRKAQDKKYPVSFTVDAYPEEVFSGKVNEIRLSSTTTQNVVTYPVIVGAPNPDLKLLPGMTASISFQVDERQKVIKIPNAALRYYPEAEYVRPEDKAILEGLTSLQPIDAEQFGGTGTSSQQAQSATDRAESRKKRSQRHVWVAEGQLLRAISVTLGLTDGQHTELVDGDLPIGQNLVIGVEQKPPGS
ncbi:MAG: efflux RND transporter periplasmic adaptor subunit [Planctomycetota bacterium]|nr:MAG: efflux RND transporter periplasmic adaptor subunit [Planctomycetota bacterium]